MSGAAVDWKEVAHGRVRKALTRLKYANDIRGFAFVPHCDAEQAKGETCVIVTWSDRDRDVTELSFPFEMQTPVIRETTLVTKRILHAG